MRLYRYVVPGLVIQAVLVGGGYATGRELVEFFVSKGPLTGLAGIALTAVWFSAGTMVSFELARRCRAFDYQSFCAVFLGRFTLLFELGYYALLLLVLSVVSSAAGKLLAQMTPLPELWGSVCYMAVVGLVVFFGNQVVERVISAWSIVFYASYGILCARVVLKFGPQLSDAFAAVPLDWSEALRDSWSYLGYNVVIVPTLIFVARNLRSSTDSLVAGALAGPLILLPGVASLCALSAFYPGIVQDALPISTVLSRLDSPALSLTIECVILGAFVKTAVGLLHGLNERIARAAAERGHRMPRLGRSAVSLGIMVVAVFVASTFGIIALIGKGYRFSSYFFLVIFFLPLMIRGSWLLLRGMPHTTSKESGQCPAAGVDSP